MIIICSLSVPCGQAMFPEVYAALGYKPAGPVPTPFAGFGSSAVQIGHIFPSILHKDAFLIFRALCKLSNKGKLDENENVYDPITLQNKCDVHLLLAFCNFSAEFYLSSLFSTFCYIVAQLSKREINLFMS